MQCKCNAACACSLLQRQIETLTLAMCARQVSIPLWALVHLPVVVTITTAVFTPKGWLHCILYVLFENAMGIVKLWAVIAGQPALHVQHLLMTSIAFWHVPGYCAVLSPVCCHDRVSKTPPSSQTPFHGEN